MTRWENYLASAEKIIGAYQGSLPLHHFLKSFFKAHPYMGGRDRRWITQLVYHYFRLGQWGKALPVKERKADVPALLEWFWSELARTRRKEAPNLSPDAKRLLSEHEWPGNVEELRLLAERLSVLYSGAEITALHLPPEITGGGVTVQTVATLAERISRLERDAISEALRAANGKKIRAAAALGISRPTLDKKIEEYGLVVEKRRA